MLAIRCFNRCLSIVFMLAFELYVLYNINRSWCNTSFVFFSLEDLLNIGTNLSQILASLMCLCVAVVFIFTQLLLINDIYLELTTTINNLIMT
jgi:hypothetical protein